MSPLEPLSRAGLHATLRADGRISVGPRERITPQLDRFIRAHRDELYAALSTPPWDHDHAHSAIADTLQRIEEHFPQDAPIGTTHGDQRLADLHEAVNTAARRCDRRAFDIALDAYERHFLSTYGPATQDDSRGPAGQTMRACARVRATAGPATQVWHTCAGGTAVNMNRTPEGTVDTLPDTLEAFS
ncbi:MAG TPA: hypothetical protein VF155_00680 [Candidatus Dormibacteraeota bacterium]